MKLASTLLGGLLCSAALALAPLSAAQAQAAGKTLNIIIPFTPGGAVDNLARVLGQELAKQDKYAAVVVDNRPGAGGQVAMNGIKSAKPDGNTIFLAHAGAFVLNRFVYDQLTYDPDRDLAPISTVSKAPVFLLVPGDSKANNLKDLLAEGKKRSLSFGSPGIGTETHVAGEVLKVQAGVQGEHIPYKGAGPALVDLASGRLDFMFDVLIGSAAFLQDGRVKVLAAAADERSKFLPDTPTFKELGVEGIEFALWFGAAAPGGTPAAIVEELSRDIGKAMNQPHVVAEFAKVGLEISTSTPAEMSKMIQDDVAMFDALLKDDRIKVK